MSGFFWLASYPKSGNTWVRLALWSLKNGGAPIDFSDRLDFGHIATSRPGFERALGIESSDLSREEIANLRPSSYETRAEAATTPLFCKVHDGCDRTPAGVPLFPPETTLGVIHIVRDPRDVALSFAHHTGWTVDRTIAFMAKPYWSQPPQQSWLDDHLPFLLPDWSSHAESWLGAPGRQPPLLVRYEDLLTDPLAGLDRMARYIGWPSDEALLERTVAATRFQTLREAEQRQGFIERTRRADRFFRRGEAGSWRGSLSEAQARRIETDHATLMVRLGYR